MVNVYSERMAKISAKAVEALNKHKFHAQYVENKEAALKAALKLISPDATVGIGGSATLTALGIKQILAEQGNTIYDHQGKKGDEATLIRKQELTADVFLTSSNAVTLDGQLVNVDGVGNRIAAMTFGPKRVIMLVGANKIVKDEAAGRERIQMLAAPLNVARLNRKTPCVTTGYCMDCNSPERSCNATMVMHRAMGGSDFHIIIIGESLGY